MPLRDESPKGRILMKLLHIISSVNPAGGGPIECVRQLGAAQVSAGHQVEIASLDTPTASYLKHCLLPVHALGPEPAEQIAVSGDAQVSQPRDSSHHCSR